MRSPGMPSGLAARKITPIIVRNYQSEVSQSPQGNNGAGFNGWIRAATPQSDEWARIELVTCQTVEIE
jgi:hypothetical protein